MLNIIIEKFVRAPPEKKLRKSTIPPTPTLS
jgi:hypothetical protein